MRILLTVLLVFSSSVYAVKDAPLTPRAERAKKQIQNRKFPNFYEVISEDHRLMITEKALASILNSLRVPHVMPGEEELRFDKFFSKIQEMVTANDETAKVYISGGMVRSLLGYVYYKLYKKFEKELHNGSYSADNPLSLEKTVKNTFSIFETERDTPENSRFFLKALGISSDFDILIDFGQDTSDALKQTIMYEVTDFINSAESYLNLRNDTSTVKKSIVPVGDVKDYQKQLGDENERSAILQGGLSLDWLAFDLENHTIRHPDGHPDILDHFFKGLLSYLPAQKGIEVGDKQIIRALRPLTEIPHLSYDTESEARLIAEIERLETKYSFEYKAHEQKDKLLRNARFGAGQNRFAKPKSPLNQKANDLSKKLGQAGDTPSLAAEFLERRPFDLDNQDKGQLREKGILISYDEFIEKHTDNGTVYHGTPEITNLLNMMRENFLISKNGQGAALNGRGFYTTKDKELAQDYTKGSGVIIPFRIKTAPQMRILDLRSLDTQDFIKTLKAEKTDKEDVNEILTNDYDIDVIISGHVLIQNAAVLKMPKNINMLLEAKIEAAIQEIENLNSLKDVDSEIILSKLKEWFSILSTDSAILKMYALHAKAKKHDDSILMKLTQLAEDFFTSKPDIPLHYYNSLTEWAVETFLPSSVFQKLAQDEYEETQSQYDTYIRKSLDSKQFEKALILLNLLPNDAQKSEILQKNLNHAISYNKTTAIDFLFEYAHNLQIELNVKLSDIIFISRNLHVAAHLLQKKFIDIHKKDSDSQTLLHEASKNRFYTAFIPFLLAHGAHMDETNQYGETALDLAVKNDIPEAVEILLKNGANGNLCLHYAIESNYTRIAQTLIEHKADPNIKDKLGMTPLHKAIDANHLAIAEMLIKKGAKLDEKDKAKQTPLSIAVSDNKVEAVRLLLEHGADAKGTHIDGSPLLNSAAGNANKYEIVELLLNYSADPTVENRYGMQPLVSTIINGDLKITELLLQHGVDMYKSSQEEHFNPLDVAKHSGPKMVALLIKYGADVNRKNRYGLTALHLAAGAYNDFEVAKILLENGANPNITIVKGGETALHSAAAQNNPEMCKLLIQYNADPHTKNDEGKTYLDLLKEGPHKSSGSIK